MSRSRGVIAVLDLCLFGGFAYGCGGGDEDEGATRAQINQAKRAAAKKARQQLRVKQLQREVRQLKRQANRKAERKNRSSGSGNEGRGDGYYGDQPESGPVSGCTDGVQVGPNTSCSFAMNVAGEYGSNPGASTINAYSPSTGEFYTLSCGPWSGGSAVCTGGNGASVYLP